MIACRRYSRGLIELRVFIVAYGLENRLCALYDPSAFKFHSGFYDDVFVIGRRSCAVESGIGFWDRNGIEFDPFFLFFFFLIYNSVHESKDKSFDPFSTIEEQTVRIGDRFIFEKFGGIVRRCLATGAFRKRMGMKGEK